MSREETEFRVTTNDGITKICTIVPFVTMDDIALLSMKTIAAEIKLGIAYEGWARVGADRYRTMNKTFVAETGSAHELWASMMVKLQKCYDMGSVPAVIAGGDGAPWIRDGTDDLGARFQLCQYHLNRALCYALGRRRDVIQAVRDACHHGQADVADAILAGFSAFFVHLDRDVQNEIIRRTELRFT